MRRSLSGAILGQPLLSSVLSSESPQNRSSQGRSPSAIATGQLPVEASLPRAEALSPNASVAEDSWTRDTGMEPNLCTCPTCSMTKCNHPLQVTLVMLHVCGDPSIVQINLLHQAKLWHHIISVHYLCLITRLGERCRRDASKRSTV